MINIIITTISIVLLPPVVFALAFNFHLKRRTRKIEKRWLPLNKVSY